MPKKTATPIDCGCRGSRRWMLGNAASGFGAMAFAALASSEMQGSEKLRKDPFAPKKSHFPATAKSVIFLYMDGGPSQVDTFDPKPRLDRENGQPFRDKIEPTQFNDIGKTLKSPWAFKRRGKSGLWVSDLLPELATCADELCVIKSMTANFSEHTNANYFLHTGFGLQGRPSMGAWATYGLGSECDNLPGFVVLNSGLIPPGGLDNFNSGFLPATFQGSVIRPNNYPLANIRPADSDPKTQRQKLDLIHQLDRLSLAEQGFHEAMESAIANHEMAFAMQTAVPNLANLSNESPATRKLYGIDDEFGATQIFGKSCLMARRLVERGVRFIELTCPVVGGDRWDQHSNLKDGHQNNARATDRPIAGLIKDLKSRGLLETTLLVWAGEFGRTPFAQGANGRDHNPFGFTIWLAGGGVKPGFEWGATDEYGYKAIANRCDIHDLHATILHLMGMDHRKLTFRYGGRDMRLTDVHGNVLTDLLLKKPS